MLEPQKHHIAIMGRHVGKQEWLLSCLVQTFSHQVCSLLDEWTQKEEGSCIWSWTEIWRMKLLSELAKGTLEEKGRFKSYKQTAWRKRQHRHTASRTADLCSAPLAWCHDDCTQHTGHRCSPQGPSRVHRAVSMGTNEMASSSCSGFS